MFARWVKTFLFAAVIVVCSVTIGLLATEMFRAGMSNPKPVALVGLVFLAIFIWVLNFGFIGFTSLRLLFNYRSKATTTL